MPPPASGPEAASSTASTSGIPTAPQPRQGRWWTGLRRVPELPGRSGV
jgi:hypothetical protein